MNESPSDRSPGLTGGEAPLDDPDATPFDVDESRAPGDLDALDMRRSCVQCGYDLRGLPVTGVCPECGVPIEHSMRGPLLRYSSSEYLQTLHRGVFLILTAIAASLIFGIVGAIIGVGVIGGGVGGSNFRAPALLVVQWVSSLFNLLNLYGWWLFSAPDPAFTGRNDGSRARRVVRITVIILAAAGIVQSIFQTGQLNLFSGAGGNMVLVVLTLTAGLVAGIAWVVHFFAGMMYVRWLAPRLPNERAGNRARTLMWLGPVLYILGAPCFMLGPLIAIILYWNLLEWIRKDIKRIRFGVEDESAVLEAATDS